MPKTIALKGDFIRKERQANAAIIPGQLVEIMSTGKLRVCATAGVQAARAFALENDLIGKGIDNAYAQNDQVQYGIFYSGTEVYAFLKINDSCVIGAFLESDGLGNLQASSSSDYAAVAIALEAITGGGGVTKRIKVEVL